MKNFWQGQNSDKNVVLEFRHSETKIQIMQRSRLTKLKYVSTYTGTYFDERVCSC